MVGAERLLPDIKGPLFQLQSLLVAALILVEVREVVEACGDVRMSLTELLFPYGEGSLMNRHGFNIPALSPIEVGEIAQYGSDLEMVRSSDLLRDLQRAE